jgi:crotonobetainyl-CoA:carnitine CoA-transferase CaiB-like acyl-CoA transferase
MSQLPLSGLRVLDLTRVLAGPLATMRLGDLGAEVLKVERPGAGDESRAWGPPFDARGESAYFLCCNRNKLSVAADLSNAADRAVILRLLGEADVVVDNFLPGALAKWDLDPAALLAAHPRLIWCTITGFGPDSGRPGYDYVVQAESGWMSVTGEPDGEPMRAGMALADVLTGKDALIAITVALAGLRAGLDVDRRLFVSLIHTATEALINVAQNTLVSGADPVRMGGAHPNLVPYQLFTAADGPLVLAVGNDGQYAAAADVLGGGTLLDPEFATNAGRVRARARLVPRIAGRIATRSVAAWLSDFGRAGVPAGAVRSVKQALADVVASPLTGIAPLAPGRIRRPPPRLDEHGSLVREHGWAAFAHA